MRALSCGVMLLASVAWAQAGVTVVEASGEAAVSPVSPSREAAQQKALEQARQQALRSAVEQAAGVLIQADTQTRNNVLVLDRVTSNATGYVKSFEVVRQSVDDKLARVTVRAQVSTESLDKDLQAARAIVKRLFASRLLIVLQEQLIDDKGIASRSEFLSTALTTRFKDVGFTIVDEKGTGSSELGLVLASGMAQGKLDAKEVARRSDADFIVYGTANVRYLPPDREAGLRTGRPEVDSTGRQLVYFVAGDYDLSMFATRSGLQLAKQAGRLTSGQSDETKLNYQRSTASAVENSAKSIVPAFVAAVFEFFRDQDVNGARLTVRVSGIPAFDEVEDVEKALGVVEGVKAVKAGEFAEGKAEFGVQFLGTSADFGKALRGATIKKRKLVVTSVRNDLVEVSLK